MTRLSTIADGILRLSIIAVAISGSISMAQQKKPAAPVKEKAATEQAKPAATEAGKPEAAKAEPAKADPKKTEAVPAAATTAHAEKAESTEDPALSNDKDMLPQGHYAHRVATPKQEKLSFIGRVQMRAMSGQGDTFWSSPGTDYGLVDFNFRRLRMGMIYNGSDNWGMIVHLRLENALNRDYIVPGTTTVTPTTVDCGTASGGAATGTSCVTKVTTTTTNTTIQDNRGIMQEANLWYNFDFMRTRITFGMINVPFNREYNTSSANLINIERSMTTNAAQQFDNGISIQFNPLKAIDKKLDRYWTIAGMVGTGHGGNGDFGFGRRVDMVQSQGNAGAQNYSPFFYGRTQFNVLGGLQRGKREVGWQDGEEIFQKEMKLSIGAGMMGTKETKINNNNLPEFFPRTAALVNGTSTPALTVASGNGPCAGTTVSNRGESCNLIGYTADATWTWNHIYLNGMYNLYQGNASQNISGYTVTAGYNIPVYGLSYIMPVIRYDFMKGNFLSGSVDNAFNQTSMIWAGLNLFHDKHLFKLQLFYAINNNNNKFDSTTNTYSSYKQNLIIFQAQATFWTGTDIANKPANTDL